MSQIDDEEFSALEAMLSDVKDEPAISAQSSSSLPVDEPEETVFADDLEVAEPPTQLKLLADVAGDDPLDFLEASGIKPDRVVPDREEPWMKYHDFTRVTSVEQVNEIVDECIRRGACSLDLETEGLDNRIQYLPDGSPETVDKIVGFCISYDGVEGFYVPVRHRPTDGGPDLNVKPLEQVEAAISRLCHAAIPEGTAEDKAADGLSWKCLPPKVVIYFWNAQFDHEFLYPVTGIDWWHPASFEDGLLACFCIYAGDKQLGLKPKAKALLRDPDGNPYTMIELKELFFGRSKDIQFALLAPDEPGVLRYAGSDAICTYKLCSMPEVVPVALKKHWFTYRLEKQTSNAVRVMERPRVRINREHVRRLLSDHEAQKEELLRRIRAFSMEARNIELDPNSPKQLSEFLFGPKPAGLDIFPKPGTNEASGQFKTDGDTLEELAKSPNAPGVLKDIVRYRTVDKFISTYLSGLANNSDANDEIRVSFKQTGAGSGRFSAPAGKPEHGYSGVPAHGIPQESDIRRDFIARSGYTMVKADYAGEELRIAANITGEKVWVDEFMNGTGDLHSITARAFFGKQEVSKEERGMGKTANFALLYGGGPQAVMRATGCDMMEAKRRKLAFDKAVPRFSAWCNSQHQKVKRELGVRTPFGRWLAIPDANHEDKAIRAACERHSTNYVIQGAGADIMKISMVMLVKKFHRLGWLKNGGDDSVRMLLTVHDELVFEIRHDRVVEAAPIIVEIMEQPWRMAKWTVPLVVEPLLGFNWKSGFAAERAKKERHVKKHEIERYEGEIPLRKFEVLVNGFIYSTTREPLKDRNTRQIVEELDQQEVVEGDVFRIIDPPWLASFPRQPSSVLASAQAAFEKEGGSAEPKAEANARPPDQAARVRFAGGSSVRAHAEIAPALPSPAATRKPGELRIRLSQLSAQTVEQLGAIIIQTIDNDDGLSLHLTDVTGLATLVAPGRYWVDKDRFIKALRNCNLLCEADVENGAQAN